MGCTLSSKYSPLYYIIPQKYNPTLKGSNYAVDEVERRDSIKLKTNKSTVKTEQSHYRPKTNQAGEEEGEELKVYSW